MFASKFSTTSVVCMLTVPLNDVHLALGAKMCPFAGYQMPIEYPTGTVAEHTAVRNAVGVFDVSHMGKVRVVGPGAVDFLNSVLANDLARISDGQAQYSLLCNEAGGVVDDLIVYRVSKDEVRIVPNAANAPAVVAALRTQAPNDVEIIDLQNQQGILAVQGPISAKVIEQLGLPSAMDYMAFEIATWQGHELTVCRTGYTGEHGYELIAPNEILVPLWQSLLSEGQQFGLTPCGLGARDTLRTEMGYPLHGQDISPDISPVAAKLGWAIGWGKPEFNGRMALSAQKTSGLPQALFGLRALDRGVPRPHMKVLVGEREIGQTTSGTFSPTLQQGIAMALLDADTQLGDEVVIDVRGRQLRAEVVKPPFLAANVR